MRRLPVILKRLITPLLALINCCNPLSINHHKNRKIKQNKFISPDFPLFEWSGARFVLWNVFVPRDNFAVAATFVLRNVRTARRSFYGVPLYRVSTFVFENSHVWVITKGGSLELPPYKNRQPECVFTIAVCQERLQETFLKFSKVGLMVG